MSALCLLDFLVIVQGVAKVLFVGYVLVRGRPVFLSPSVNASLREVVIVMTMRGVYQASPVMFIRTEVMGSFASIGAMVPEPAIPAFLRVVARSSAGIDCWHHTSWLGPSYWLPVWFDPLYDVIYACGHFGSFETFFDVDPHFGQLSFFFVILTSLGQYEFFMSFHSSVPPF